MESRVARPVRVYSDLPHASSSLGRLLALRARASVRERGTFRWVLAGGHTPEPLYRILARRYRETFPWHHTEVFFGDERCVGPHDPASNFRAAQESLLSNVPIPPRRIHRLRGELPPAQAVREYTRSIGSLGVPGASPPRFDLVLLGMGPDGHTASLFPHAPALRERKRPVVVVPRAGQPPFVPRLSLTLPALASSREVCFLVSGEDKAKAISSVFRSFPEGSPGFPASLVQSQGPTRWFLDKAAGRELPSTVRTAEPD